jgi:hypothetical protein
MPKVLSEPQKRGRKAQQTERVTALRKRPDTGTMARAAAVDPNKPLTEKQKHFVKFWAMGDSLPNAYTRAGYSINDLSYAYRMAKMPNILALYNEEKRLIEEAGQMSRKKVMDGLLEAVEMAKLMAEPATMVSGWREIGRMCGYYEPKKVDINVNVAGNAIHQRLNALSDAELLKLVSGAGPEGLLEAPMDPEDGGGAGDDDDSRN